MKGVLLLLAAMGCASCAHRLPFGFLHGSHLAFTDDFSTGDGNHSHNDNYIVERPASVVVAEAKAELVDSGKYLLHHTKDAGSATVLSFIDPMTHEARTGPGSTIIIISSGRSMKDGVVAGTLGTWTTVCVSTSQ